MTQGKEENASLWGTQGGTQRTLILPFSPAREPVLSLR